MGFSCSVPPGFVGVPTSSTDNAVPRFDGTTGNVLQTSGVTIDDNNIVRAGRYQTSNTIGQTAFQMLNADSTPKTRFLFIPLNAETGSGNTGFDLNIYRYADDGSTLLGTPLTITRSNGVTTLSGLNATQFGLNKTPIGIQAAITAPSGGATIDSQARTAINSIISTLQAFGFNS